MQAPADPVAAAQPLRLSPAEPETIPDLGAWSPANPVQSPPQLSGQRTIIYTGWLTSSTSPQDGAAEGVWTADFATWGPAGREALAGLLDRLAASADGSRARVCFRPHARHLLSDPQACLNMLRERGAAAGAGPFEVVLEPAAFLTPEMVQAADDHIDRALEALLDRDDVPAVLLSDVEPVENPEIPGSGELRLVAPGSGLLGRNRAERIAEAAIGAGKPLYRLT